jgi:hypothetical protein
MELFFHDPIFNQQCAVIERRGNPIDGDTYFAPQNGGTTPTDADRSRFATIIYFDYQKNMDSTITGTPLQTLLALSSTSIQALLDFVSAQMTAIDGTGGIPLGFQRSLGDINGDGTGDGVSGGAISMVRVFRRLGGL